MRLLRAWSTLAWLSFARLLWSANTVMVLFPLSGCVLFVLRRDFGRISDPQAAFKSFSDFVLIVLASFIVPICAVAFGTTSIGGDREDHTLVFLLVRPVPRVLVLWAKFVATLPLALGFVVGCFFLCCRLAGPAGAMAFDLYLAPLLYMTLAYVALFHLFAVAFRHATIIALVYSFFMELLLGNMPGIIKRVAINYYGRSMIFAAGKPEGLAAPDPNWFEPLSGGVACWALIGIAAGSLLLAMFVFDRREYRDLT